MFNSDKSRLCPIPQDTVVFYPVDGDCVLLRNVEKTSNRIRGATSPNTSTFKTNSLPSGNGFQNPWTYTSVVLSRLHFLVLDTH